MGYKMPLAMLMKRQRVMKTTERRVRACIALVGPVESLPFLEAAALGAIFPRSRLPWHFARRASARRSLTMTNFSRTIMGIILLVASLSVAVAAQPVNGARDLLQAGTGSYGCTAPDIAHYVARRASGPITIDGRLDEPSWQKAEKSGRFVDMASGAPGF